MGTWEKIKKIIGLGPDCVNGGTKDNLGNCACPRWFEGEQCEEILCANGGRANKKRSLCHCPDSRRFHGLHCEQTICDNNGRDNGDGTCDCVDDWYTGQFCEHYSSPWGVLFGAAGALLLLLVLLCVLCRLRPCPPRSSSSRGRRRRRRGSETPPPPLSSSSYPQRPLPSQPLSEAQQPLPPPYPNLPKLHLPPPAYSDVVADLDKYPRSNPLTSPPPHSQSQSPSVADPSAENSANQRLLLHSSSSSAQDGPPQRLRQVYPDERDDYDQV